MAKSFSAEGLREKRDLRTALVAARRQIIALHPRGDERTVNPKNGDQVQFAVLNLIDRVLKE